MHVCQMSIITWCFKDHGFLICFDISFSCSEFDSCRMLCISQMFSLDNIMLNARTNLLLWIVSGYFELQIVPFFQYDMCIE